MVRDEYVLLDDGLRIHLRSWPGPPFAPTVVLLHGYTGHARTWDTLAERLVDRRRVVAIDARGHGESGWAPDGDYSVARQVADVVDVLAALRLPRATVLGLSMGGRTALDLAATHPDLVDRLVVVDIGPEVAASGAARIGARAAQPDVFDDPDEAYAALRAGNAIAPEAALRARARQNLMLRPDGRWTWRYDAALRGPGGTGLPRPDPAEQWALLPRITAPTLLVRGELSDVLAADDAARMVREIPHCTFVEVAGSGHSVPLDKPDEFAAAVLPFLTA